MKKALLCLIASSLPIQAESLFAENSMMQEITNKNVLAYHHSKSESGAKNMLANLKMTAIDICVTKAIKKYPGHVLSMESEIENDRLIYELDIKTKAGPEIEIECDTIKHTLHDYEIEVSSDDKRFSSAVKISEKKAREIALAKYNGKVVDVEYSLEDNNPNYEFDIYMASKGYEFEVEVDGVTGKIIETEMELYDIGAE